MNQIKKISLLCLISLLSLPSVKASTQIEKCENALAIGIPAIYIFRKVMASNLEFQYTAKVKNSSGEIESEKTYCNDILNRRIPKIVISLVCAFWSGVVGFNIYDGIRLLSE
jgi:hypothetical protein